MAKILDQTEIRERYADEIDPGARSWALHATASSFASKRLSELTEEEYFAALLLAEADLRLTEGLAY
jgi:hypothetical protein